MLKNIKQSLLLITVILTFGCASIKTTDQGNEPKWKPEYRLQAGINHGGIVENTDLSEVENVEPDAFSGATKIGVNTGAHILFPILRNNIETGLDFMLSSQTFSYNDAINNYDGKRKIKTSQFMVPVTYNFGLIRKKYPLASGLLQLKLGYAFQYNLFNVTDNGPDLPEYSTKNFSHGLTFGIASTPFHFNGGSKLGFYFDLYRGSQIYEDFYNQSSFEMPGSSFFKTGIVYQF